MSEHPTIKLHYRGQSVDIDVRMAPLVKLCWSKGLATLGCCQGYLDDEPVGAGVWDIPRNRQACIGFGRESADRLIEALGPQHRVGPETVTVLMADGSWVEQHEDLVGRERGLDNYPEWEIAYTTRLDNAKCVVVRLPAAALPKLFRVVETLQNEGA
jgi:hypothetical protein